MNKQILISVMPNETRTAILEDHELMEIAAEREDSRRLVGNIYKGRVENVLPGMQAAFVNIGTDKNAFLFVDDVVAKEQGISIEHLLHIGQEVIVQIVKEPFGTKGPRATTHLTLPGRYLVLMPTVDYVGISRRITNEEERERLKQLAETLKPDSMGLIVRTVAGTHHDIEFSHDIAYLTGLWNSLQHRIHKQRTPSLLYRDVGLLNRMVRDVVAEDVDSILLDHEPSYDKVCELLQSIEPALTDRVRLYQGMEKLFDAFHVNDMVDQLFKRQVWLKNGGYLVIDKTEALTVIDVNTGKFTGTSDLADTVFQTNLQAVTEICRQLRLRDIGGIIVIDFIDMLVEDHQQRILDALRDNLTHDRTKTNVLGFTQLGLVEMTRKKSEHNLFESSYRECPCCGGTGVTWSDRIFVDK